MTKNPESTDSSPNSLFIPAAFRQHLISESPRFASQTHKIQLALTHTLYSAVLGRQPHPSDPDNLFPIHWKYKQKAFGSADAFNKLNEQLGWFDKIADPKVGKYATGYCVTAEGTAIAKRYFEQALTAKSVPGQKTAKAELEGEDGKSFVMPRRAIRSKTATGANASPTNFILSPLVKINTEAAMAFHRSALAWQNKEACPPGGEWLHRIWNDMRHEDDNLLLHGSAGSRVERAAIQSLALLDLARSTPTGDVLPTRYIEHASGRLYAEGHLNLQTCVRELRQAALKGCFDIDIENCHFVLLSQMASRSNVNLPYIDRYLANKSAVRQELANDLTVPVEEAKSVLVALIYGARLSGTEPGNRTGIEARIGYDAFVRARENKMLADIKADIDLARKAVIAAAKKQSIKKGFVVNDAGHQKANKETPVKLLSHLLQGAEAKILRTCVSSLQDVILLQHDGFTSRTPVDVAALSTLVKEHTGYHVQFSHEEL